MSPCRAHRTLEPRLLVAPTASEVTHDAVRQKSTIKSSSSASENFTDLVLKEETEVVVDLWPASLFSHI